MTNSLPAPAWLPIMHIKCISCGEESLSLMLPEKALRCRNAVCPRPLATRALLADADASHMVLLDNGTYVIQHPLRERTPDAGTTLFDCDVFIRIQRHSALLDNYSHGLYRVVNEMSDTDWHLVLAR